MQPVALTVSAAATALSIGKTKLYEIIGQGLIRSFLLGRRRLVLAEDIENFVQRSLNRGGR